MSNSIKRSATSEFLLPHRKAFRKRSGKAVSAWCVTAVLMLTVVAQAHADATAQVQQALENHVRAMLEQQAARQGWQGMQLRYEANLPASTANLPLCAGVLQIRATGDAPSAMERQQLEVNCPDTPGWSLNATAQAHVFLPAVHAEGIIDRGQTIRESDIRLERINIAKARRGYYNRLDEVIGMAAKRRIRAGQTITPSLLEQAMAVKRGEPVKIVASNDGIEASASGEALGDGQPGEVIRVRNTRSGKVIDAKVIEEGIVTSTF
ncbi:flagellar basal body P-ring formation chaperone FlgA [Pseudomonas sp. SST3]|uniref:flagellar basal body P-ring formation chaperone FlgA n=1 Tax=Pseudomonas sp. SST3 TaxID=2267882 RepID=UPI000E03AC20|nr:flagellar basal body P-ring formation chaperone FlgA [Pseudomonas sp. SST3]NKQ09252.1 flagellar basal body P-ring formation protein FlgA [Pseudomonas sp. SST3]